MLRSLVGSEMCIRDRVYSIYTDYQEGQIAINKSNFDGKLTSFKKASDLPGIKKETLENIRIRNLL